TALPDPVSFPAALFCPLSAALSAGILSQACVARRVKGCALGTAAVCAMLLFPAAANVFPFVYVTLCVCQFALELRAAATLFTRK
ncbi:MAG: hypothetical protein IKX92_07095, partial [Clostridia bacterium]|nr:hypothetical protein [Clostridia bacterium]